MLKVVDKMSSVIEKMFAFILLMALSATSFAQVLSDAQTYLDKLSHSQKEQDYSGTFVYKNANTQQRFDILHVVKNDMEYEKLSTLSGSKQQIIRHGHNAHCIHLGEKKMRKKLNDEKKLSPHFTDVLISNPKMLSDYYHASIAPGEIIADIKTVKIILQPRDSYRFAFVFWLAKDSAFMLKSHMLDQAGRVLESMQFERFELNPDYKPSEFEQPDPLEQAALDVNDRATSKVHNQHSASQTKVTQPWLMGWQLTWLPAGFSHSGEMLAGKHKQVYKLMYTDGLSSFTLFLDPNKNNKLPNMVKKMGSSVAVVRKVYSEGKVLTVTVVGEIPAMTAKKIAAAVQLAK